MLKLKYLFNNKDLAKMILDNWEYDLDDPNLFEYYRISANAIYWCKNKGNLFILRFSPASEKTKSVVLAELEFTRYLNGNGFHAIQTIPSRAGNELELVSTPWGDYHACAFSKAPGMELGRHELTNELIFEWGSALGKLHKLSADYIPECPTKGSSKSSLVVKRDSWQDKLKWIEGILYSYPVEAEVKAKTELALIGDFLSTLPTTKENYGLIHYDFEPDNIFYDESTRQLTVIDFDDSMYNWFVTDICIALDSLKDEIPDDLQENAQAVFIKGYRAEYPVSDEALALQHIFKRFTLLYGYVRVLNSIEEKWSNEPNWMSELRLKLNDILVRRSSEFGKPLV